MADTAEPKEIDELHLDLRNPRLPENVEDLDEEELLAFVAEEYDSLRIARSISQFGYFESEPLIVVEEDGRFVVVEGNRRLAALKLLRDPDLRLELHDRAPWDALESADFDTVPVVVKSSRKEVAPVLGYRHISGIEPWDPWAKARFIASIVEQETHSFSEAAALVGESETDVRSHYRNHAIVGQLRESEIPTDAVTERFGVFTRAMQSTPIRDYIGAPSPSEVEGGSKPLPDEEIPDAVELLSWVFGDAEHDAVIDESRDLKDLSTVLASEDATEVLRETRNLEEAFISAGGVKDRLLRRLNRAETELRRARADFAAYAGDEDVLAVVEACRAALDNLEVGE